MSGLESKIILPPSLGPFFMDAAYCESTYFEDRKSLRLRIRCKAIMSIEASPPSIQRDERDSMIYIKDISKRGICLLSHQQLWPEEKLLVFFQHRELRATIVRCRRLGEFCWECGGEITYFRFHDEQADGSITD